MDSIGITRFRRLTLCFLMSAFMLGTPFAARCGQININGICEVGCPSSPPVSSGMSESANFNFNYTFGDGDIFNISGVYTAAYSNVLGSSIYVDPTVTYIGAGPSVAADTVTFDLLQGYFDSGPGSWAGTYSEDIPLNLNGPAGSTVSGQLFYDGEGVGLAGPFAPGNYLVSESKFLDFGDLDTSDTLSADYNFVFDFTPGLKPGQGGGSSVVPEPALAIPSGLCLLLSILHLRRRNRRPIVYNQNLDGSTIPEENL
jgi:hypothetical protein